MLVNVSRGELIDESAVAAALDSGHLGGFAMDVGRAPDQRPSPLLAARSGVVATPHLGGLTPENADAQASSSVEQVRAILDGRDATASRQPRSRRPVTCMVEDGMSEPQFPAGACDTHMHFYDSRYAAAPSSLLRPPDATIDQYRHVQASLGLQRVVVVQPSTYGLDNSCTLDAVDRVRRQRTGSGGRR